MAIVMLKDLPGGAAPGTSFPKTDLCTYVFVENAAKNVLQGCLSPVLGKGEGRGGSLGFVNPTGYDIAGTCMVNHAILKQLPHLHIEKSCFRHH